MGTRHLIIIWYKGRYRLAQYGQWDGHPQGQGLRVLRFLKNKTDLIDRNSEFPEIRDIARRTTKSHNITALKTALDNDMIYEASEEEKNKVYADCEKVHKQWEQELVKRKKESNETKAESDDLSTKCMVPMMFFAPTLHRDAGALVLTLIAHTTKKLPVALWLEWIVHYGFTGCEWAYLLDLDENMLEIYAGPEKSYGSSTKGRLDMEDFVLNPPEGQERGYRPKLVKKYEFGQLMGMDERAFVVETNPHVEMVDGEVGNTAGSTGQEARMFGVIVNASPRET